MADVTVEGNEQDGRTNPLRFVVYTKSQETTISRLLTHQATLGEVQARTARSQRATAPAGDSTGSLLFYIAVELDVFGRVAQLIRLVEFARRGDISRSSLFAFA